MNLRQRLIDQSSKAIRRSIVEIPDGEAILKVEVRTPTLAQTSLFAQGADDPQQQARTMVKIVIQCAFDPDSGASIFTPEDEDMLLGLPAQGSFIEPIVNALTDLMSTARAAAKN